MATLESLGIAAKYHFLETQDGGSHHVGFECSTISQLLMKIIATFGQIHVDTAINGYPAALIEFKMAAGAIFGLGFLPYVSRQWRYLFRILVYE